MLVVLILVMVMYCIMTQVASSVQHVALTYHYLMMDVLELIAIMMRMIPKRKNSSIRKVDMLGGYIGTPQLEVLCLF